MNNTIYFDSPVDDYIRRQELYQGQLFVYSPSPSSIALSAFAREMIQEAFGALDPLKAQYTMPVEKYVDILADLKPKFIHHPKSKQFIQRILTEFGCDLNKTYFDVPRLRTATSDEYLTTGESNWPLLLPMVKSCVRAMDAVQIYTNKKWGLNLETFTVTGSAVTVCPSTTSETGPTSNVPGRIAVRSYW